MGLQVFFAAISVYGWYHWLYGGEDRTELRVSATPRRLWPVLAALWLAGTAGLATLLARTTDADMPLLDSALTVGSLLAQWMMTRKYVGNWAVWVGLDVVYIGFYWTRGMHLTAFLYLVYLGLASSGFVAWRKALVRQSVG